MRGDILSVATIFHQTGGRYPQPEQKLPCHCALPVPEMLPLLRERKKNNWLASKKMNLSSQLKVGAKYHPRQSRQQ